MDRVVLIIEFGGQQATCEVDLASADMALSDNDFYKRILQPSLVHARHELAKLLAPK